MVHYGSNWELIVWLFVTNLLQLLCNTLRSVNQGNGGKIKRFTPMFCVLSGATAYFPHACVNLTFQSQCEIFYSPLHQRQARPGRGKLLSSGTHSPTLLIHFFYVCFFFLSHYPPSLHLYFLSSSPGSLFFSLFVLGFNRPQLEKSLLQASWSSSSSSSSLQEWLPASASAALIAASGTSRPSTFKRSLLFRSATRSLQSFAVNIKHVCRRKHFHTLYSHLTPTVHVVKQTELLQARRLHRRLNLPLDKLVVETDAGKSKKTNIYSRLRFFNPRFAIRNCFLRILCACLRKRASPLSHDVYAFQPHKLDPWVTLDSSVPSSYH